MLEIALLFFGSFVVGAGMTFGFFLVSFIMAILFGPTSSE